MHRAPGREAEIARAILPIDFCSHRRRHGGEWGEGMGPIAREYDPHGVDGMMGETVRKPTSKTLFRGFVSPRVSC